LSSDDKLILIIIYTFFCFFSQKYLKDIKPNYNSLKKFNKKMIRNNKFLIIFLFHFIVQNVYGTNEINDFLNEFILKDPDDFINTTQLIRNKGYTAEEHNVTTSDGYIINIQRITGGKSENNQKPIVFLQHGTQIDL
jgi:hypothetical protein